MTDLDKLIEAVEGGVDIYDMENWDIVCAAIPMSLAEKENGDYESDNAAYARYAYNGSLDAAKALHEALLPGWIGYADTSGFCFMYEDEKEWNESSSLCIGNPARAWLLAILKAYRSQL